MPTENSPEIVQFEQELLETYKRYLPRIDYTSRSVHTTHDGELLGIHPRVGGVHHHLNESAYHYNGPLRFIHYTSSIHRAIEVFQRRAFRLSSMDSFNDPQEFNFIAKNSHFSNLRPKVLNEKQWMNIIKSWRGKTFAFSFCKYEDEYDESFEMWRLYGGDGRGAAIVFEIDPTNVPMWFGHYLSSVQYGDSEDQSLPINQLLNDVRELWERYPYPQINEFTKFPEILLAILSFHKDSIWNIENEVRLVVTTTDDSKGYKKISTLSYNDFRPIQQIELEIFSNRMDHEMQDDSDSIDSRLRKSQQFWKASHNPVIRIKEIIVGYNHRPETVERLSQLVFDLSYDSKIPFVRVRESNLRGKFMV